MPTTRSVPTRRIAFDEFGTVPRHFASSDNLIQSHLTASLSGMFPDGEDFFVRSVRRYRDRITEPELKRQVAGFIGQESIHGREHRALNDRLAELGYPTKLIERITKRVLAFQERVGTPVDNLAVTAALEHFTATLAEVVLTNGETQAELDDPEVGGLFLWHALEESEHKAVAFDVYKAIGGSERIRVRTMQRLRVGFVLATALAVVVSLLGDRAAYRPGNLRRSWRTFRASPMMSHEVLDRLRDYDRPDFHPDDHDTTELVARWRDKLFGEQGTLTRKLVTSAA